MKEIDANKSFSYGPFYMASLKISEQCEAALSEGERYEKGLILIRRGFSIDYRYPPFVLQTMQGMILGTFDWGRIWGRDKLGRPLKRALKGLRCCSKKHMIYDAAEAEAISSFYTTFQSPLLPFTTHPIEIRQWEKNEYLGEIGQTRKGIIVSGLDLYAQLQFNFARFNPDTILVNHSGEWLGFRCQEKPSRSISFAPITYKIMIAESLSKDQKAIVLASLIVEFLIWTIHST